MSGALFYHSAVAAQELCTKTAFFNLNTQQRNQDAKLLRSPVLHSTYDASAVPNLPKLLFIHYLKHFLGIIYKSFHNLKGFSVLIRNLVDAFCRELVNC